jgi:N-acetylglucosamine malate deacetylase 1
MNCRSTCLMVPLVLSVLSAFNIHAQVAAGGAKRNVLIVAAHPDDWEIGMGGTVCLMKDRYNVHAAVASRGERGKGPEPSAETAALRTKEAEESARRAGVQLHFLGKIDGEIFADREGVGAVEELLRRLDPVMVFLHWPLDKPDHAAASAMGWQALGRTGMLHDRETYFFEVGRGGTTLEFEPRIFVNIDTVWQFKNELVHCHDYEGTGRLQKMIEEADSEYGRLNRCGHAEAFMPAYPPTNDRWKRRPGCSLLFL